MSTIRQTPSQQKSAVGRFFVDFSFAKRYEWNTWRPTVTLRTFLRRRHLTVAAFARRCRLSQAAIYRYLEGSRHPTLEMALRIEKATAGLVTPRELLRAEKRSRP
jgi:hypothetical protein